MDFLDANLLPWMSWLLCLVLAVSGCRRTQPAEVVIRNGTIYTGNSLPPKAEAIAVNGGRIVFVGSDADVESFIGPQTRLADLRGNTALPGFTDSHRHLDGVGMRERTLNLEGTSSLEDLLEKIRTVASQKKAGEWIIGMGWIEAQWPVPKFPTRWDLDKVSANNPVYLVRADGHGGLTNSLALRIAGIARNTPDPFGGEIMKDPRTGEPNGMFLDAAQDLVRRHIPPPTDNDLVEDLKAGIQSTLAQGWTTIHVTGGSYAEIQRLQQMYQNGEAKLRIYYAVRWPGPADDARQLLKEGPKIGLFDNRFAIRSIKVTLDGALGSKGAALLEPYADHDGSGLLTKDTKEVLALTEEALKRGIQIMTHAIGDRANRETLNIYEQALADVPVQARAVPEPRLRIEHAQILHPADLPRFAKLRIIPSMQPSHAITDLHFAPSRLGMARLGGAYAWKSLLDSGVVIAGGSDAPVERGDPRIEFYAAVARKDLKGFQGEGWHPEQSVSREEALKMFTSWAAYAAFEETIKGTIEPGKVADLTVFSKNIMTVPEQEIPGAEIAMTIINGEVVYAKTPSPAQPR